MSLVVCSDVGIAFGADTVLAGLDLRIDRRDRLAIVGANGAGKSSLLRVIAGDREPSEGSVERMRGLRIADLPQDAPPPTAETVLDEVISARSDLLELHGEMRALEQRMSAAPADLDAVLERYGEVQHRYTDGGGYELEARAREALGGLGLGEEFHARHPRQLSGGQVRRVEMAKLLVQDADLLLVDEPTNHLDLAAIEWLEEFLAGVPAALVLISHDRRFLDGVCTRVLELAHAAGEEYAGSYSDYVKQRGERHARRRKEWETQQDHIQHQEEYIRKYKAGQRAKQARGRQTLLDRLERVPPPVEVKRPKLRFRHAPGGQVLLRAHELHAGRGAPLVRLEKTTLAPRDRIAIVGPNGSGKSTLLHTLAGELPPVRGKVMPGGRLHGRLYRQDLDRDAAHDARTTVLEDLLAEHPVGAERGRTLLGALLFGGDDVHKSLDVLSGGERARLEMGKLALEETNLLWLDEPTNHLDIPAQEVLEEAIQTYPGAVVLVTHDRALIDAVATRTWSIEGGEIREVAGGYSDLQRLRRLEARAGDAPSVASHPRSAPPTVDLASVARPAAAATARAAPRARREAAPAAATATATRQGAAGLRRLEAEIGETETALADVRRLLGDPATFADAARGAEVGRQHDRLERALAELYESWAAAQ